MVFDTPSKPTPELIRAREEEAKQDAERRILRLLAHGSYAPLEGVRRLGLSSHSMLRSGAMPKSCRSSAVRARCFLKKKAPDQIDSQNKPSETVKASGGDRITAVTTSTDEASVRC
jgi:hypothetical protein